MQLLLLHYNNYFNRIIKKKETIADYKAADTNYKEVSNINFNPGDGVATSLVLGLGQTGEIFDANEEFDYLVAYETVNNEAVIDSRWFILEQDRKRAGQYELTLKRDVLADNYNAVINSPIFLEKGFINDVNDPLLYNSEAMKFNQIKQSETPLMDETKSGWVVGYIPSEAFPKVEPEYDRVEKVVTIPRSADITVNGLSSWSYWQYCSSNPNFKFMADNVGKRKVTVKIKSEYMYEDDGGRTKACDLVGAEYTFYPNSSDAGTYKINKSGTIKTGAPNTLKFPPWYQNYGPVTYKQGTITAWICGNIFNLVRTDINFNTALDAVLGTGISIGDASALRALQDKIILDSSTNTYYKIKIISASEETPITVTSSTTGGQAALDALNNALYRPTTLEGNYTTFTASNSSQSYAIELTSLGVSLYVDLNSDRAHLNDAPYDMFCIPFSDTLKLQYGSTQFTCSKNVALSMATEIARDLGSGSVYDVQLLPYCPNRNLIVKSSSPSSVLDLTGIKYDLIKESATNNPKSAVIWCTESTFQVPISVESNLLNQDNEALNRKVSNECDVFRLVSQNYSAIFEFSPAKSGGVDGFLADCTYKPWSPYIHILPKLKGLYGDNFVAIDDARGLICGGDMSLPQLSNAWANYQLQNKTYQEMFDRQIKNMDVQNDINRQGALAQAILSPITGIASGAAGGAQGGGAYGAIAGAAIGAIGGGITAALDYKNTIRMMEENRQYSIDMYGYNLQNIQAVPTSLTKTSALTYNTRVWPFIEYYTCTDAEKTALRDKMKYNGMTIMKVGKLNDYLLGEDKFYKGQLIRLNIKVDSHMAYEIYNELNKGVYL